MKMVSVLAFGALALSFSSPALANNLVILPAEALAHSASVDVVGSQNVLQIVQTSSGAGGQSGNRATVWIEGDGNGSGTLVPGLAPNSLNVTLGSEMPDGGLIVQSGFDNAVSLSVFGMRNLFSFVQQGSLNSASGSISGLDNQASIQQIGQNNVAAFSQNGNGNIVSISQTSW